jgi:hypothetical protein
MLLITRGSQECEIPYPEFTGCEHPSLLIRLELTSCCFVNRCCSLFDLCSEDELVMVFETGQLEKAS